MCLEKSSQGELQKKKKKKNLPSPPRSLQSRRDGEMEAPVKLIRRALHPLNDFSSTNASNCRTLRNRLGLDELKAKLHTLRVMVPRPHNVQQILIPVNE